ncbi:hypothetical protein KIN20_030788 [Parelaphostrongylus tenuis]|uniref:Uncharacterized protein n=1 Tax=Parelaphostrongylus tenuis TaxID=148309 RepID=A0AAD5WGQ4_PARTN|nr:hypothetical protein KIN20_030788 [Parelaphostrongylus tenuis]
MNFPFTHTRKQNRSRRVIAEGDTKGTRNVYGNHDMRVHKAKYRGIKTIPSIERHKAGNQDPVSRDQHDGHKRRDTQQARSKTGCTRREASPDTSKRGLGGRHATRAGRRVHHVTSRKPTTHQITGAKHGTPDNHPEKRTIKTDHTAEVNKSTKKRTSNHK